MNKKTAIIAVILVIMAGLLYYFLNPAETEEVPDKTSPPTSQQSEIKTDTGRYVGLADNNFFEVEINDVEDDRNYKVFMITEQVRSRFEELDLQEGEEIKIQYVDNENRQNLVQDIERVDD